MTYTNLHTSIPLQAVCSELHSKLQAKEKALEEQRTEIEQLRLQQQPVLNL